MCLKGFIAVTFESSEPLHLLRLNGRVSVIPTYRLSDTWPEAIFVCFTRSTLFTNF